MSNSDGAEQQWRQQQLTQRTVVVQRGEKGYGLTLTGDNPVFIESVKESTHDYFFCHTYKEISVKFLAFRVQHWIPEKPGTEP